METCDFCEYAEDCHTPEDCIYPEDKSQTGSRIPGMTVNEAKEAGLLSKCLRCLNYAHYCGEIAYIAYDCNYNSREEMRAEIFMQIAKGGKRNE